MNKYNVSPKAKQAADIICFCLLLAAILIIIAIVVFSPPQRVPAPAAQVGAGRIISTCAVEEPTP